MALNDKDGEQSVNDKSATASIDPNVSGVASRGSQSGSPAWVVPLYVVGLVLMYVGQRVVVEYEKATLILSGLGLSALLAATALRFMPVYRGSGDRSRIERLLGFFSLLGLLAVAVYFASTDWGILRVGFADSQRDTRENAQGLLQIVWVVLAFLSVVPMLFAEAALYPMRQAPHLELRRVVTAAASGATLVLAATYGALFVYSASQTQVQADFSYFKTSDPGESTVKMAQSLDAPLRITAFFPEVNEVRHEIAGYFGKLTKLAPNVQFSTHDRYLEPKLARDMKVTADGSIVIEKGDDHRVIILGTDITTVRPKLKTWDRDFQETLYKVVRSHRTAFMTVGHSELNDDKRGTRRDEGRTGNVLKQILQKQNYQVRNLGLAEGLGSKIPDDAAIVMILGPLEPFAPEEIEALKRYIDGGGHVLMAFDVDAFEANDSGLTPAVTPEKAKTDGATIAEAKAPSPYEPKPDSATNAPATSGASVAALDSIQKLTALVGLTFDPGILANQQKHLQRRGNDSDNIILMTNRFSSHASVSTLSRNSAQAAVVMVGASSLDKAKSSVAERIDFTLRSLSGTFADKNGNYKLDKENEQEGIYNIGAAVTKAVDKPASDDKKATDAEASSAAAGAGGASAAKEPQKKKDEKPPAPPEMRSFVLADADVLSDLVLTNFPANQMLAFDAIRWLGGEESFAGEVNNEEDVRIEHTKQKDLVWFYGTILGVPAIVLGGGLGYSRRSRRSKGGRK